MSNPTPADPFKGDSASIIADALVAKFADGALSFALNQETHAVDGNKDAWTNVVKNLRDRSE